MPTDTSERGLERLICTALAGHPCEPPASGTVAEPPAGYGGVGWSGGNPHDYDREYCVDGVQLGAFLRATQPEIAEAVGMASTGAGATHASPLPDQDGITQRRFLARLQGEVSKRGTIDVLRTGLRHGPHHLELFYGAPSPGNETARERFEHNRFTVSRQLRYSRDEAQRALDIGLFINGLPVFTFELKNSLTKQTADDAVQQYRRDRNWRERLFEFGRCVAHFAADDGEVRFCTRLQGKASWFLPFNRGWNDGAGNPPNPGGIKTDYLWRAVLSRGSLTDVLENYAQVVASRDDKTGRSRKTQIWPRYHQLDVVRRLLADAGTHGAGRRYLIQHSAGSGKSNSIAWLARQLIDLKRNDAPVFDSIIVVTDRRILDRQIHDTIRQFSQVSATVGHADRSGDLRRFIESGKKIIISTVQKFPFILDEIGNEQRGRRFAILIDEAHSSQGGRTSGAMVVTNGVERAIQYFHAVRDYLRERKSRHQAIVAFSGEFDFGGARVSEASLNGFPSGKIDDVIQQDPYRFLICADKFQAGYDEPLLHTMYVDKTLSGIKAVQTLSRLNRAHPQKHDAFVLDFLNDADRVHQLITETIPARVAADSAFRNAQRNSDRENARIEHDKALLRVMTSLMKDDTELFRQFMDNAGFKRWLTDTVFTLAYEQTDVV